MSPRVRNVRKIKVDYSIPASLKSSNPAWLVPMGLETGGRCRYFPMWNFVQLVELRGFLMKSRGMSWNFAVVGGGDGRSVLDYRRAGNDRGGLPCGCGVLVWRGHPAEGKRVWKRVGRAVDWFSGARKPRVTQGYGLSSRGAIGAGYRTGVKRVFDRAGPMSPIGQIGRIGWIGRREFCPLGRESRGETPRNLQPGRVYYGNCRGRVQGAVGVGNAFDQSPSGHHASQEGE